MAVISTQKYQVYIDEPLHLLKQELKALNASSYFVLIDENTYAHCLPLLKHLKEEFEFNLIQITSGEQNKTLDTCRYIWSQLTESGADRQSVLINLGGGVIGDMGGFAASCFMRGIRFVQVPTTLLSQVDASVGSKLGIDFNGIKNLVGVFNDPEFVFIYSPFLKTLPIRQLKSGFAETIKHALIYSYDLWKDLNKIESITNINDWTENILQSVSIKKHIVDEDPFEKGLRKILNFGHTIGHAIESSKLHTDEPLLHGEAVVLGMLVESNIALQSGLLKERDYVEIEAFVNIHYNDLFSVNYHMDDVLPFLKYDKKKVGDSLLFALIDQIGNAQFDVEVNNRLIETAFKDTLTKRDDK